PPPTVASPRDACWPGASLVPSPVEHTRRPAAFRCTGVTRQVAVALQFFRDGGGVATCPRRQSYTREAGMKYLTTILACALVVGGLAASGAIGQDVYTGRITRIDQPAHVIIFDDGRMYRVAPSTVVLVNDQPVMYSSLQPGAYVVVRSGEPVVYRDGQ